MAQQTAVEWLVQWSKENPIAFQSDYYEAIKQAKQMEKEQIMRAHGKKINGGFRSNGDFFHEEITGEQYYNETYKK